MLYDLAVGLLHCCYTPHDVTVSGALAFSSLQPHLVYLVYFLNVPWMGCLEAMRLSCFGEGFEGCVWGSRDLAVGFLGGGW